MKKFTIKFVSFIVVFCIVIGSFCVFAAEPGNSDDRTLTDEEVYAKFAEAFPEDFLTCYSNEPPAEWDPENQEVVSSETRALSETEEVTRLVYSNGARAYVGKVDTMINYTSGKTVNVDLYATVNRLTGILHVSGFTYTNSNASNARIDNGGRAEMTASSYSVAAGGIITKQYEDANGPAIMVASGMYTNPFLSNTAVNVTLQATVSGNNSPQYTLF